MYEVVGEAILPNTFSKTAQLRDCLVQLTTASWAVVSCFFCQTLVSKTASWAKQFFLSSHKDISWDETEKSSLLQSSFLSLNYV
jgi:hypothetical protein